MIIWMEIIKMDDIDNTMKTENDVIATQWNE